jgi:hypothetical protein
VLFVAGLPMLLKVGVIIMNMSLFAIDAVHRFCVRRSGKCGRTLAWARCVKLKHDRAARQSSLLMVAVSALFWLATAQTGRAQQLPQAEVKWNEAPYRCYGIISGQVDENTPSWEQQVPIFLELRSVDGITDGNYTCGYESVPAVAPDAVSGQPLVEALTWGGQAYDCLWLGQSRELRDTSAPANVWIRDSALSVQDRYTCSPRE